jgi:hypothetical protein
MIATLLAACSGNDGESGAGQGEGAGPAGGMARVGGDTVAAVLQTPGTAAAALRFTVGARPVAGQAFPVTLSFSSPQPVPSLNVRIEATELQASPASAQLALPGADEAATLELSVTAQQPGLAELTVRVAAEGAAETVHAIPVLVAAP